MLTPMLKANAIIGLYSELCRASQSFKYQPSSRVPPLRPTDRIPQYIIRPAHSRTECPPPYASGDTILLMQGQLATGPLALPSHYFRRHPLNLRHVVVLN
jgi:hypothetical protein